MVAKRKAADATTSQRPAYWDDPLSPKQQTIFAFIRKFTREHGEAPTTKDVMAALEDISASAIRYNLKALEQVDFLRPVTDGGIVRWSPTGDRALRDERLWELVDRGLAHWTGGKPKGPRRMVKVIGEGYVSDYVHQDRR